MSASTALLVGTRKGAWIFRSDERRGRWAVEGPHFLGHIVHHLVADPRAPGVMLLAAKTGHLGPTIFRSADGGRTFKEIRRPPAFPKAAPGRPPARRRLQLLARAGTSHRARPVVGRHLAPRPLPERGWRGDLRERARLQRSSHV